MGSPAIARFLATLEQQQQSIARLKAALGKAEGELRVVNARLSSELAARTQDREAIASLEAERDALQAIVETLSAGGGSTPPGVVDPPVVEPLPGGEDPWPHAFAGKGVAAAKAARPPGWADHWATVPARREFNPGPDWSDPLIKTAFGASNGGRIELRDLDFLEPSSTSMHKLISVFRREDKSTGPGPDMVLDNLRMFIAGKDPEAFKSLKWFARIYDLDNVAMRSLWLEGAGSSQGVVPEEHGVYFNPAGDSSWEWCFVRGFGGKPFYHAHRADAYESYAFSDNSPYYRETTHAIRNCVAIDNDQDAVKGSYAATWFDAGSNAQPGNVLMQDTVIANHWDFIRSSKSNRVLEDYGTEGISACGGFMVSSYQGIEPGKYHVKEARFERCLISLHGNNFNPIGSARNAERVVLKDSTMEAYESRGNSIHIGAPERFRRGQNTPKSVLLENVANTTGGELWIHHVGWQTPERMPLNSVGESHEINVEERGTQVPVS